MAEKGSAGREMIRNEAVKVGRHWIVESFKCKAKEFALYPRGNRKPRFLRRGCDMVR